MIESPKQSQNGNQGEEEEGKCRKKWIYFIQEDMKKYGLQSEDTGNRHMWEGQKN